MQRLDYRNSAEAYVNCFYDEQIHGKPCKELYEGYKKFCEKANCYCYKLQGFTKAVMKRGFTVKTIKRGKEFIRIYEKKVRA